MSLYHSRGYLDSVSIIKRNGGVKQLIKPFLGKVNKTAQKNRDFNSQTEHQGRHDE